MREFVVLAISTVEVEKNNGTNETKRGWISVKSNSQTQSFKTFVAQGIVVRLLACVPMPS